MIETTQKDSKGRIQTLGRYYTEQQFGEAWWPNDVAEMFATEHNMVGSKEEYLSSIDIYIRVPVFKCVAYNEKGKVLDVGHLVGIARKYNKRYLRYMQRRWWRYPGTKSMKRRVRGGYMRKIHTTPERRWAHAWDDEEFAPKCRCKRNAKNLPESWDDYWRNNQKNWKKFRKHQWKEK